MKVRALTVFLLLSFPAHAFVMEWIVRDGPTVRKVEGVVLYQDRSPAAGVTVDVYDHPEALLEAPIAEGKQRKIASAITDEMGRFRFRNISPGNYEVRANFDPRTGSNRTSMIVRVRRLWFWPLGRPLKIRYTTFA